MSWATPPEQEKGWKLLQGCLTHWWSLATNLWEANGEVAVWVVFRTFWLKRTLLLYIAWNFVILLIYLYRAIKNNHLIKQKMSVSPKHINRFMKYISRRVYSPCLVPQRTELFFAFNELFFQKHCKWRKFNRPKENKSGRLYKSQSNACSWLWHVLNFQTLEGLISADHIWYIIVQSKYMQTYCIQKCRNKLMITRDNLSGFIFAFLYDQYTIWLGIQAGEKLHITRPAQ